MQKYLKHCLLGFLITTILGCSTKAPLIVQSDFGVKDGAVSAMKGVAVGIDPELKIFDLTHEIPEYNIWEAAYRLYQTAKYWPNGSVFVSVVDPGVGSERKSIAVKTKNNQYFITPDNGTLTLIADKFGISEVRQIDENKNRLPNSNASHTFHGRDVYMYTGAKLASKKISFEQIGNKLPNHIIKIPYEKARLKNPKTIVGNIPILDVQYGNVWTNIDKQLLEQLNIKPGDIVNVVIKKNNTTKYNGSIPYANTFDDVAQNKPLVYLNSLLQLSIALNMNNFAKQYNVSSGPEWSIELYKTN